MLRHIVTLTSSRKVSISETDSHSPSQEAPHYLWNPKFHYRYYKRLSLVLFTIHLNPVHTFTSHFLKKKSRSFDLLIHIYPFQRKSLSYLFLILTVNF